MRTETNREQALREEILRTQLEIQDHSFDLIRKELYDNIGQALVVTKLHLQAGTDLKEEEAKKLIDESEELISKIIRDLRLVCNPVTVKEIVSHGVIYALKKEVAAINRMNTCRVDLIWNENFPRLDVSKELILFGITQELVSVILDSSSNKEVLINIGYSDSAVKISVKHSPEKGESLSYPNKTITALNSCSKRLDFRARLIYAVIDIIHIAGESTEVIMQLPVLQQTPLL